MPNPEPGIMDRPIILNPSPYSMITTLIYRGLTPRERSEDSAAPAMAVSRGISDDGAPGAFNMRSRANFHGRRLIREGSERNAGNAGTQFDGVFSFDGVHTGGVRLDFRQRVPLLRLFRTPALYVTVDDPKAFSAALASRGIPGEDVRRR